MDVVCFVQIGGFEAEVRIKESQFAHSICGEEKSDSEEARESAAACLLTKLHQNTTTANDVLTKDHLRFMQNHWCVFICFKACQRYNLAKTFIFCCRSSSSVKVTNPSAPSEDPFKMEKQTSLPLPTAVLLHISLSLSLVFEINLTTFGLLSLCFHWYFYIRISPRTYTQPWRGFVLILSKHPLTVSCHIIYLRKF